MEVDTPLLLINYKAYREALVNGIAIAKEARKIAEKLKTNIIISPRFTFLKEIAKIIPVVAQHINPYEAGSLNGSMTAEEIKSANAIGSLINHAEKPLSEKDIEKCVELCRRYDLASFVCARNSQEAEKFARFMPDFIAVEPPELIGGGVSVSTAKPEVIKNAVEIVKKVSPETKLLCGAGVKTKEDVIKAMELGSVGVLVASGIVKSENFKKSIEEIASGLRR